MRERFHQYGLYFAWLVSIVATGGSLYLSEVAGYVPCQLCWFQRIFMYPLVILLGIASYRGDRSLSIYALPLTFIGGLIALYHVLEQNVPGLRAEFLCQVGVPCFAKYINWLGFISIPVLSLTAFTLITIFLFGATQKSQTASEV